MYYGMDYFHPYYSYEFANALNSSHLLGSMLLATLAGCTYSSYIFRVSDKVNRPFKSFSLAMLPLLFVSLSEFYCFNLTPAFVYVDYPLILWMMVLLKYCNFDSNHGKTVWKVSIFGSGLYIILSLYVLVSIILLVSL